MSSLLPSFPDFFLLSQTVFLTLKRSLPPDALHGVRLPRSQVKCMIRGPAKWRNQRETQRDREKLK